MIQTALATPPCLDRCDSQAVLAYYQRAWTLEDRLWQSLVGDEPFYLSPDPLRNLLIFYLGHTAVFYINKLRRVGLIQEALHPDYEDLFAVGVDPEKPHEIAGKVAQLRRAALASVWGYRQAVYHRIADLIHRSDFTAPVTSGHPLWALMMAIEHQYIHIETSSVLIRQLPVEMVRRPADWVYLPGNGDARPNPLVAVAGGPVRLGKPQDAPSYGWDIDYGDRTLEVAPFRVSKYQITNAEFLAFVQAGGYETSTYWSAAAWEWKTQQAISHPKFWLRDSQSPEGYRYRAMFDEMVLPGQYPVEVNYHEAVAYCRWYNEGTGRHTRLMGEAEWHRAVCGESPHPQPVEDYNLDGQFGSPHAVGARPTAQTAMGIYDLRGNTWEWLRDHLTALPGYQPHPLYEDYSASYFDHLHQMMAGGSWISCGAGALPHYRNWFRPNFYQHAGFRLAEDI
ncbi:5-histidylcysteine sulfoxide synthase [Leptothoe sp. PORK10 BA2]|uniref:5-histidylcysteine sulfoxide synthase n=1 Tax=Leptothoe sp. PORK10 BA2 TaxID=3110254 RepID=UPI002B216AEC|nr:5-histidylcysteine sulfoxide synthase [Leptothoe sp. PORK10 BA2]MEA5462406.1 5-histidylcysteine sulfoxide synthase [Leptothoe sp. PORK10 BA2]